MPDKPVIQGMRTVARSRLFEIQELDLKFSNGVERRYERLMGAMAGAVLIVPMLDDRTVGLVREYAAGVDRYELGFPKGKVESGEAAQATAQRELQEEIGYAAGRLEPVMAMSVAPGYFGHTTEVFLARDLRPERIEGDEPEAVELVPWKLDELDALLEREDFTEARSIAALFLIRERLNNDR